MIPDKISFTGLEIDPRDILYPRRYTGYHIPNTWARVFLQPPKDMFSFSFSSVDDKQKWIAENTYGRWALIDHSPAGFAFEDDNDFMIFMMNFGGKDG
jgi:hypothetical protein